MLLFVSLVPGGLIRFRYDSPNGDLPQESFKPRDIDGMAKYLAKAMTIAGGPGIPVTNTSSTNHPTEYGLPRTFNVNKVLGKAFEIASLASAIRFKPMPPKRLISRIEKMQDGFKYPLTLVFEGCGKRRRAKRDDVVMNFNNRYHVELFLHGLYCANRLHELREEAR